MKLRKMVALTATAVLSLTTLSALPAGAANGVLGDVDQDGVITGHDSAMVSRYLNVDANALTEEQLALADMNGDGAVDQTDADLIHESEVYAIGEAAPAREREDEHDLALGGSIWRPWYALKLYTLSRAGADVEVVKGDYEALSGMTDRNWYGNGADAYADWILDQDPDSIAVDEVSYHLLDADADGDVDIADAYLLLLAVSSARSGEGFYTEGRYDLVMR